MITDHDRVSPLSVMRLNEAVGSLPFGLSFLSLRDENLDMSLRNLFEPNCHDNVILESQHEIYSYHI